MLDDFVVYAERETRNALELVRLGQDKAARKIITEQVEPAVRKLFTSTEALSAEALTRLQAFKFGLWREWTDWSNEVGVKARGR